MYLGFEPADDTQIENEDDDDQITEDVLMFYKVVFDEDYKVISITGVSHSLTEDNLRYLLSLID